MKVEIQFQPCWQFRLLVERVDAKGIETTGLECK